MRPLAVTLANNLLRLRMAFWRLIYYSYAKRYRVSPTFLFRGVGIHLYGEGAIELGPESYLSEFCSVNACAGQIVRIGRRCKIASGVRIYTYTADADTDFRVSADSSVRGIRGDVEIGDGAWIGVNVYIGPGITIGANSIVGANSVVTGNVPAGEIWGGVPARYIRSKREPAPAPTRDPDIPA